MNKKIGILGWKIGANSFGITLPYYNFASRYGEVVVLEPNNEVNTDLDLLILPGGPDLDVSLLSDDKFDMSVQRPCPIRTFFMRKRLQQYIEGNIPLFGICLGHQMLGVHTGNKLITDMYHETNEEDRSELVHEVQLDGKMAMELGITKKIKVNSLHHQAICPQNIINAELVATYRPSEKTKGYYAEPEVEALKYNDFRGYSVQWHPEEIYDDLSHNMILDLLK